MALILCAGLVALATLPAAPGPVEIGWRMALCGVGFGLFQSPNNRMMLASAPRERAGAAGGMLGTARLTGQTIGEMTEIATAIASAVEEQGAATSEIARNIEEAASGTTTRPMPSSAATAARNW